MATDETTPRVTSGAVGGVPRPGPETGVAGSPALGAGQPSASGTPGGDAAPGTPTASASGAVPAGAVPAGAVPAGAAPVGAAPVGAGRPVRPPGAPGMGSIFVLAFLVILVPGLVAYSLLRWAGLAIGPAGLLGLLIIMVGLGIYPSLLQRLGWVRRRGRRPARNRSA